MIAQALIAIFAILTAVLPGGQTVRAAAVTDITTGVWWSGQVTPTTPPPAHVPAGGLWVSSTTAGTTALSAVRFSVAVTDRQPILNLPIAMLSTAPTTVGATGLDIAPHVIACSIVGKWTPPPKGFFGALKAAPAFDCAKGQVLGAPSVDGKTYEFDLGRFITDTNHTISIAIVPASNNAPVPAVPIPSPIAVPSLPQLLLPPTFDATFNPVTAKTIDVIEGEAVTADDFNFDNSDDVAPFDFGDTASFALGDPSVPVVDRGVGSLSLAPSLARRVARQVGLVKTEAQRAERTLAASVFVLLCMWAWLVNRDQASGAARPFRSLYDGAPEPPAAPRHSAAREGSPPSLR